MIADTMKIMMEQLGYRVAPLLTAAGPLRYFKITQMHFDLVITDMTMPR
jgi:CheY-like chemotaxis protein